MITRREFISFCQLSLVSLPLLGCLTEEHDTDVTWFLSEREIIGIGKSYSSKVFSPLDDHTVLINGWVITLAEAEICKKKYLERA